MLSYQHAYHAGNAADVHKHALLAVALEYMARKDKPLTYLETHAGRALYDLDAPEARKTGEAAAGIAVMAPWFAAAHPFSRALDAARRHAGPKAYPGSPAIASTLLRPMDRIVLAERHPQEVAALRKALPGADIRAADGPSLVLSIAPPEPRRGMVLIDPSYEVKTEFSTIPDLVQKLRRKWPVGVLAVWYPILRSGADRPLADRLRSLDPEALSSEVRFPPVRPGHGLIGSGMWIANPPFGLTDAAADLAARFAALGPSA